MTLKTIIYGAGCQGRAIMDILVDRNDVEIIGFIDDTTEKHNTSFYGIKVLGGKEKLKELLNDGKVTAAIVGIGGFSKFRKHIYDFLAHELNLQMINVIHSTVTISKNNTTIGKGNFIGAGVVIGPDCVIGDNTIINNSSCLTLDIEIKDHVNVTPGVNFAAGIKVEEEAYLGIGCNIKQYVKIGKRAIIGGGAVVLEDIPENVVAVGIPAKAKRIRDDFYENEAETNVSEKKEPQEIKSIIAIIPARGGSKGIPGKNIKLLDGKPLIAHSIEQAKRSPSISRVIVSTDDSEIAKVAEEYRAEVQIRPLELAQDDTPMMPVLHYVTREIDREEKEKGNVEGIECVVLLQPTNPLRTVEHIELCIQKIREGFSSSTTVTPLEIKPVCITEVDDDKGNKCNFTSDDDRVLRQQIKRYRVDGTVFAYKKETLLNLQKIPWDKENNAAIVIKGEEAMDIDEPLDWMIVENIIRSRKGINFSESENSESAREKVLQTIKIGNKEIGGDDPCFIIAEAGSNHNGDINLAKQLVDKAVEAGADAVKFQTFTAEGLVTRESPKAEYQLKEASPDESYFELLKKLELTKEEFIELKKYCEDKGIIFLSTPHSNKWSVDLLEDIGILAYKIGSGDVTNLPFLEYVASKGKPVIMATGMSTLEEVKEAVSVMKKAGNNQIVVLQCTSNYPAAVDNVNMKAMKTLEKETGLIVGYSDHTGSLNIPVLAIGMGAKVYEKHYTLDKTMEGPDHKMSMDPQEMQEIVNRIREIESAFGTSERKQYLGEAEIAVVARKSVVASGEIRAGEIFTADNLDIKRPEKGLRPKRYYEIVGKKATRDLLPDELLQEGDWN